MAVGWIGRTWEWSLSPYGEKRDPGGLVPTISNDWNGKIDKFTRIMI